MPPDQEISDDYVVELLKRDAINVLGKTSSRPSSSRPTGSAPKPNQRFLRNLVRDIDSHNSALLAREAEEARARLRRLREDKQRVRPEQQLYSVRARREENAGHGERNPKRRRTSDLGEEVRSERQRKDSRRDSSRERQSRRSRHSSESDNDDGKRSRARHHGGGTRRSRSPSKERHRVHHRERSSSRNRHKHRSRREKRQRSSSSEAHPRHTTSRRKNHHRSSKEERSPASDSDPLEALIGPPPPEPTVRARGRGATNGTSTIDSHFADDYDPSTHQSPDPDEEDDWDQALEALRDRQKWKQQGAERLRAAGFTDEEVRKWEKGGEKGEDDVRWSKRGEDREWDRGKVVGEDGDVDLKPEWGRLKGT